MESAAVCFDFYDGGMQTYRFNPRDQRPVPLLAVDWLHKTLQAFLDGLEGRFPKLADEFESYVDAGAPAGT